MCLVWYFKITIFILFYLTIISNNIDGVDWGEKCDVTDECSDHRYVCKEDEFKIKRCDCDKFHEWLNETLGCIQIYNTSHILNVTITKEHDNLGELEEKENRIFAAQLIAGLFVFTVIIVASISTTIYCFYIRKSDKKLKESLHS